MGRAGLEHLSNPAAKPHVHDSGGSNSGNIHATQPLTSTLTPTPTPTAPDAPPPAPTTPADPDLAALIAAWPTLPPTIRAGIAAMVKAAGTPDAAREAPLPGRAGDSWG